jgi:dimethylamine monooxygenase subunit B
MSMLDVKVASVEQITPLIKHFTLIKVDGSDFPAFSGGSHVVVSLNIGGRVHRNPYSLMGAPNEPSAYHISVRKQEHSRGGSVFMHEVVDVGTPLQITYPVNLFSLAKLGRKHILIAGGIGITPFMSQIADLKRMGAIYELHYAFRSPEHGAFADRLAAECGSHFHAYTDSNGTRIDLVALLSTQPLGTHVYVCGPSTMVAATLETARHLGWPENHIHSEQFLAPPVGEPFTIELARSNIKVQVPSEMSMLEAIEAAGVEADFLCRGGACGRCELEVLESNGELLHHDHFLTDAEKSSCKKIMPCVSRARCDRLVLDI